MSFSNGNGKQSVNSNPVRIQGQVYAIAYQVLGVPGTRPLERAETSIVPLVLQPSRKLLIFRASRLLIVTTSPTRQHHGKRQRPSIRKL